MFTIEVDLSDFEGAWKAEIANAAAAVKGAVTDAAQEGIRAVRQDPPFVRRTGALQDLAAPKRVASWSMGETVDIVWRAPHALYVEKGTPPHIIRPKGSHKLRFYWERIGEWVELSRVEHPGTQPRPFTPIAERAAETFLTARLERVAEALASRINAG